MSHGKEVSGSFFPMLKALCICHPSWNANFVLHGDTGKRKEECKQSDFLNSKHKCLSFPTRILLWPPQASDLD